jgi:hypothetical protein
MAIDPIELVFVTHLSAGERRFAPEAGFDRSAGARREELVSLMLQGFTW